VTTSTAGTFELESIEPGTYDIGVKGDTTLRRVTGDVVLAAGPNTVDLGTLLAGDGNNDNVVNFLDLSLLVPTFGTCAGGGAYNAAVDFNGDTCVTFIDLSLLATNFGTGGQ